MIKRDTCPTCGHKTSRLPDVKKIQVRFPIDVWERVRQVAKENESSFNAAVLEIIRQSKKDR